MAGPSAVEASPPAVAPLEGIAKRRRSRAPRAGLLIALAILGAALVGVLLDLASVHAVAGNSDAATVVLEGQSLAHGNLSLAGWSLSLDSFWSVDAPFYAVGVALLGVRAAVINLVPAAIAALVVVTAAGLAAVGRRRVAAITGVLVVVALLGLPSPALSFFFLQGPWHVATALYCVLAFAGLASGRRLGYALAALAFAAGILGDFQMIALGLAPAVLGSFVAMARERRWRVGVPPLFATVAGGVLAVVGRLILDAAGGFALVNANPTARLHQVAANIGHLPARWAGILGVGTVPIGPTTEASRIAVVHGLGLAAVVLGVVVALGDLAWRVLAPPRKSGHAAATSADELTTWQRLAGWRLDDLLAIGVLADLVTFVIVSGTGNGDYARYLTAGVIEAVILGGRLIARVVERPRVGRIVVVTAAAFLLVSGIGFALDLQPAGVTRPAERLAGFLESHQLRRGIGDYWSSSIVTVDSARRVLIRPVIATPTGKLARYGRQSTSAWYAGVPFQFLVFDAAHPWRDVGSSTAVATFGQPERTYIVGTYHVLVWSHPLSISPVGFSNA